MKALFKFLEFVFICFLLIGAWHMHGAVEYEQSTLILGSVEANRFADGAFSWLFFFGAMGVMYFRPVTAYAKRIENEI